MEDARVVLASYPRASREVIFQVTDLRAERHPEGTTDSQAASKKRVT
jgi:hypothetical protein